MLYICISIKLKIQAIIVLYIFINRSIISKKINHLQWIDFDSIFQEIKRDNVF